MEVAKSGIKCSRIASFYSRTSVHLVENVGKSVQDF